MRSTTLTPEAGPFRYKLTVEEFDRMWEVGIFEEDDRIELLDGELYEMPPEGDWHNAGVDALAFGLSPRRAGEHIIRSQGSVKLTPSSEPQPDVAVLRFRSDFYREGGAQPGDILLVAEVADTSTRHDRNRKLPLYAAAGVPEVWIVTRDPAAIEVYRDLRDGAYAERLTFQQGDIVTTPAVPGVAIRVSDITG